MENIDMGMAVTQVQSTIQNLTTVVIVYNLFAIIKNVPVPCLLSSFKRNRSNNCRL